MTKLTNAIKISGQKNYMIGRVFLSGRNILGKVQAANGVYEFQTETSNGFLSLKSGFEILTCYAEPSCRKI